VTRTVATPPTPPPVPRRRGWPKLSRDLVLFGVGIALTINEAVIRSAPPRPDLIVLYAAMMGSPLVINADAKRRNK